MRPNGLALLITALPMAFCPDGASAQQILRLGVGGLGQIGASTPFDRGTLKRLYPGFRWHMASRELEHGVERTLRARARKKIWFSLVSDRRGRIGRIEVKSPNVSSWLGPRVGDTFDILQRNGQLGACTPGQEKLSGSVVCQASQTRQVRYVFSGAWEGPDGAMPNAAAIQEFEITRIVWQPARFAGVGGKHAERPAFDCSRASGNVEKLICRDAGLARLDRRLAAAFTTAMDRAAAGERAAFQAVQRGWIKGRNDCWKSADRRSCVEENYRSRIAELEALSK